MNHITSTWFGVGFCITWLLLFSYFQPLPVVDEHTHQRVISEIVQDNKPSSKIPLFPGYHWIIASFSKIPGPSLKYSRSLTTIISIMAILMYASIPSQEDGRQLKRSPILLALLPILFPYTAMVYTDAVSVFFVLGAVWAQSKRIYWLSAAFALVACLVRQSNVIWVMFIISWIIVQAVQRLKPSKNQTLFSRSDEIIRQVWNRILGHLIVLGFMGILFLQYGSLLHSDVPQNRPSPNIGNIYMLSFFCLLLWAPVWIERFRGEAASLANTFRRKTAQTGIVTVILAVVLATLVATYDNWHPWNQYTWFLRNIPLILMDNSIITRIIAVVCLFLAVWLVTRLWLIQPNRQYLLLLAAFTFLFLLPHSLVEPRYLIIPFVLSGLFVSFTKAQESRLAVWFLSVNLLVGSVILSGKGLW